MSMWMLPRIEAGTVAETPLSPGPVPGLGEIFGAGLDSEAVRVDAFNLQERRYWSRLEELAEGVFGEDAQQSALIEARRRQLRAGPDMAANRAGLRESYAAEIEPRLFETIRERAEAGVGPFRDLPKSRDELRARVEAEVRRELDEAEQLLGRREEGLAGAAAEFGGAAIGGLSSPDLALLPFGAAGGMPLWRRVLLEGALGATGEVASLPAQFGVAEQFGLADPDPLTQTAAAAAFAGALPLVGRALTAAGGKVARVTNERLVRDARARAASLPPEQRGALDAAERELGTEALRRPGVERVDFNADVRQAEGAVVAGRPDLLPERAALAEAVRPSVRAAPGVSSDTQRIIQIESGGDPAARNPNSSAGGLGQHIDSTWLALVRRHRPDLLAGRSEAEVLALKFDRDISTEITELGVRDDRKWLGDQGLPLHGGAVYLAHFAGRGGAKSVLDAPAEAPIASVLSAGQISANAAIEFNGKSFAEFTAGDLRAWARHKMGLPVRGVDEPPAPSAVTDFDPMALRTAAATFQYKAGGDAEGVTERLLAEKVWDPNAAIGVMVFERADGVRFIADGHQRLGLARRMIGQGDEGVRLQGYLYREVDGWTPADIRLKAALRNIRAETGTALDAAKILRDHPELRGTLAFARGFMRQAEGLGKLAPGAFAQAINGVIPEHFASVIGRVMPGDEDLQQAAIALFARHSPENLTQAEAMAAEMRRLGLEKRDDAAQGDFFGGLGQAGETRILDRARVLDGAIGELKHDKALFDRLNREQERIEEAGNRVEKEANEARRGAAERAILTALRLADEPGPVRDALDAAAGAARRGNLRAAVGEFTDALRAAIEDGSAFRADRGGADAGAPGAAVGGGVRALDDAAAGGRARAAEAVADDVERAGGAEDGGLTPPGLFDDPVDGPGARAETAMLDAEVRQLVVRSTAQIASEADAAERAASRAEAEASGILDLDVDGEGATARDVLDELDDDAEFASAVDTVCGMRGAA